MPALPSRRLLIGAAAGGVAAGLIGTTSVAAALGIPSPIGRNSMPPPFDTAAPTTPVHVHTQPSPHTLPDSSNDGIDCMCGFTIEDRYSI